MKRRRRLICTSGSGEGGRGAWVGEESEIAQELVEMSGVYEITITKGQMQLPHV